MNIKHISYAMSWRLLFWLLAVISFICGFFAPHQWAVTAVYLVLIWVDQSNNNTLKLNSCLKEKKSKTS